MRARKRFGQHFLHDEAVLAKIAAAVRPQPDDALLEIGPGTGALTQVLTGHSRRYVAIEVDRDLAPALQARFPAIEVITADVLRVSLDSVWTGERFRIVGNLPYNITSALLLRLVAERDHVADMHFMVQREVAERLAAGPGNKTWGRLTVMVQRHCAVELLFDVGPESFRPRPKVVSSVIRLTPLDEPPRIEDDARFAEVVRLAFSQRRKRISNALGELGIDFAAAGVDPGLRADALSVDDFVRLAEPTGET